MKFIFNKPKVWEKKQLKGESKLGCGRISLTKYTYKGIRTVEAICPALVQSMVEITGEIQQCQKV